nr:hypothetical protein [Tanacetum cinerariifolium]
VATVVEFESKKETSLANLSTLVPPATKLKTKSLLNTRKNAILLIPVNAARNYEILHERDDDDAERPDKRNFGNGRDQRNRGQQSNRSANFDSQQSRGPSEGYSYPKDCKKNTTASTSGQADKKPGASGRVFAITEDHATKTSGTITGTLFIYEHAVFVLFDTGATHSVISSIFASRVTTTPTLLDHVLCISTPMQDSVRITHVYRDLPLQFDDKIRAINALPLDMCEFDIILGDIHAPEFIYHGSLPGKSMQIISALQACTLLSHGYEGFLATIHDTTSDVSSIHDQPVVSEFRDVFPDKLPGIPPVCEVEFNIELILRAEPISKAPYRMAPIE